MMATEVQGKCPACGWKSLFVAKDGYVTCARLECPNPTLISDQLDGFPSVTPDQMQDGKRYRLTIDVTGEMGGFYPQGNGVPDLEYAANFATRIEEIPEGES